MFAPTASPVVQRQSTWHIGPTTCVFTSRSRANFDSVGSSCSLQPLAHRAELAFDPAGELDRLGRAVPQTKQDARVIRSARTYVLKPPDSATARAPRCSDVESPPSVWASGTKTESRARAGLDHRAVRLAQLVLAELELERPDDRDRDHGRAGQHLLRLRERLEVDPRHFAVEPERLLPRADRVGIVLPGPLHGHELRAAAKTSRSSSPRKTKRITSKWSSTARAAPSATGAASSGG